MSYEYVRSEPYPEGHPLAGVAEKQWFRRELDIKPMSAEQWAEAIVTAREQYTDPCEKSEKWRQQIAYSAACIWTLDMAGVVDGAEICNAVNKYVGRIPSP